MAQTKHRHYDLGHEVAELLARRSTRSVGWRTNSRGEFQRLAYSQVREMLVHFLVVYSLALEFFDHLLLRNAVIMNNRVICLETVELAG